jgi:hypothetical protein
MIQVKACDARCKDLPTSNLILNQLSVPLLLTPLNGSWPIDSHLGFHPLFHNIISLCATIFMVSDILKDLFHSRRQKLPLSIRFKTRFFLALNTTVAAPHNPVDRQRDSGDSRAFGCVAHFRVTREISDQEDSTKISHIM